MAASERLPGDINRNEQILISKSDRPGNDHFQYVWIVACARCDAGGELCGHRYGSNGSDFFQRKCPRCQGGTPGLDIAGLD